MVVLSSNEITHDLELDARGLACPLPLLKAKLALSQLADGMVIKVMATDSASQRDLRFFAERSGHTLVQESVIQGVYCYWIRKASSNQPKTL